MTGEATTTAAESGRPELMVLTGPAPHRVIEQIRAKGGHCESCGGTDFAVGSALPLGFLFLDEADDAYLVALTCRNPRCRRPRSALRLRAAEFLSAR